MPDAPSPAGVGQQLLSTGTQARDELGPLFVTLRGRREPEDLARFRPLPELDVPTGPYLLVDVDTGPDTLGMTPAEVLPRLVARGRSPLTIAEGLSVLATDPGVLRARNAFSLLGSRAGDKRVPALWTSARRPRLGWCYQGAPHTWLGSASCAGRLGKSRQVI